MAPRSTIPAAKSTSPTSLSITSIKIEVVRGAESAVYGTDAVAGVIQIFSHRGETRVPAFSIFGEGGTFSSGRGGGQVSGLLGKFDYSAAGSYFQTDGQGPNDSFRNRTLSGNFGYTFNENNQLRLSLRNNTSNAGIPGQTLITPPSLYTINNLENFSANARWDFVTGTHWHNEISGSEAYNRAFSANPIQSFYATDPIRRLSAKQSGRCSHRRILRLHQPRQQ